MTKTTLSELSLADLIALFDVHKNWLYSPPKTEEEITKVNRLIKQKEAITDEIISRINQIDFNQ